MNPTQFTKQAAGSLLGLSLMAIPATAVNAADVELEGNVEASCALTAGSFGTMTLSADGKNLSSREDGGSSAQLTWESIGNWKLVARGISSAYTKDGSTIASSHELHGAFDNQSFVSLKRGSTYGTTEYNIIPPSGTASFHASINDVVGEPLQPGLYSVRQTITCEAR